MEQPIRTADEERASYRDGYEREILAAQNRLAELEQAGAGDGPAAANARERIANAKHHLEYYSGEKGAERRPAGAGKSTR